jgi:hypothetical protein
MSVTVQRSQSLALVAVLAVVAVHTAAAAADIQ